jgi:hypothetical protein
MEPKNLVVVLEGRDHRPKETKLVVIYLTSPGVEECHRDVHVFVS